MITDDVKEGFEKVKEGLELLRCGPTEHHIDTLIAIHDEFYKRCCPFEIGDKVQLAKTPEISKRRSSWLGSKHFLIKGATGVVVRRDYWDEKFRFDIRIDNQTYMSFDREVYKPVTTPAIYSFSEDFLEITEITTYPEEWIKAKYMPKESGTYWVKTVSVLGSRVVETGKPPVKMEYFAEPEEGRWNLNFTKTLVLEWAHIPEVEE